MVRVRRFGRGVSALALSVALLAAFAQQASALGAGGLKGAQPSRYPALSEDGRYVAFSSSSPLSSVDTGFISDVYVRDLDTGLTLLASRGSGASGAAGNGASLEQTRGSISGDGRYVVFESSATNLSADDLDTAQDVYVRDVLTSTTTLVSRATGAAGAKGNGVSNLPQISTNGRYVVFQSQATNLDPADLDATNDIYMRDLLGGTTRLVSRAAGVNGAKANAQANTPSVSGDGPWVAFASTATNLSPDDTDGNSDVFVRDISANATTLVSRASGAAGVKGNGFSGQAQISANGYGVAWCSNASNLDPADTDGTADGYFRNLLADTTELVTRANGAGGVKSNGQSCPHFVSTDGQHVSFGTDGTNVDPADTDTTFDVYIRDVLGDSTTLVSRATGSAGAKGNAGAFNLALSGDAHYAAWLTTANNLSPDDTDTLDDVYVRDTVAARTSLESRATPGHARPKGATPLRVALVPAYSACASPNRTHGPPLAFPSVQPAGTDFAEPDRRHAGCERSGRQFGRVRAPRRSARRLPHQRIDERRPLRRGAADVRAGQHDRRR